MEEEVADDTLAKNAYDALARARSASDRSWWAGKILQQGVLPRSIDHAHHEQTLRDTCLHARQTFLSSRVHGMVAILDEEALWREITDDLRWKIDNLVRPEIGWTLDWQRLNSSELMPRPSHSIAKQQDENHDQYYPQDGELTISVGEEEAFLQAAPYVRKVSLLVHRAWFDGMSFDRFVELYSDCFSVAAWPQFFPETYALMREGSAEQSMLAFCQLASAFERTLADAYASYTRCAESLIPRKLNELLVAEEIVRVIGSEKMSFIRLFIGPLSSLNLRNLLWHGFLVPPEFNRCYTSLMMLIYLSVARILCEWGNHQPRPLINLGNSRYPNMPPSLHLFQDEMDYESIEKLFGRSYFVMETQRPVLSEMLRQHKSGNYVNALVLLFPQFEQCLRRVFAIVNNCPEKVLSAETDILYTTLDILLATSVEEKGNHNMIFSELGDNIMNILLDTFVWDESVRIRDVLAHGAALPDSVPVQLIDSAMASFIATCLQYDVDNTNYRDNVESQHSAIGDVPRHILKRGVEETEERKRTCRSYAFSLKSDTIARSYLFVKNYQPAYHPRAHLKARMRRCYENLLELKTLDEKIKSSPVPGGLPVFDDGVEVTSDPDQLASPKDSFSLKRVELEALQLAQRLQQAIIDRYGALCFFPADFRPVEFVMFSSSAQSETEHSDHMQDGSYRITAHFCLREQSKVEILSALADEVSTLLREVSEKYINLYELVVSRKAWKRHRTSFVQLRESCTFILLAAVMLLLVADECVQCADARGDFALLCKNCSGSLASCAKTTKWKRLVELFSAFLGFHTVFDFRKSLLSQKEALKFDVKFAAYVEQLRKD